MAGEPRLRRAPGDGWRLTEAGETEIGGALPVNPSGGVLSSNPIGASGLLRFAEAALQVMGKAGEHQVDGARTALGHAYGGGSQYFSMWVVASTPELTGQSRLRSAVGDRQALDAVEPARAQPLRLAGLADVGHAVGDRVEDQLDLQPGQVDPEAVVRTGATEAQVRVRAAQDVEPLRVVEDVLVEVGRPVEQADPLARR